ncbi:MAG: methionine adenosyltransferase [Microbacteriaceae bacterium]|nr:methionine adenosyltransferase [Microbacteriaceae bacterium]
MSSIKTAEAVCIGHPDKVCDLVSDQILTDILAADPAGRVAVETLAAGNTLVIAGEITTSQPLQIEQSAHKALRRAGYEPADFTVQQLIRAQSPEISAGVTTSFEARNGETDELQETGAGDQGTVYGYATAETEARLPLPLVLSRKICQALDAARLNGTIPDIKSDGKAQVSIRYSEGGEPEEITAIVTSVQHAASKDLGLLEAEIREHILPQVCGDLLTANTKIFINPAGPFVLGGPEADTGLTGRKLMIDTYGGFASHGGGAFSGKDPSKVDRSGAYMARLIAKTVVDAGFASRCTVAISYAIGKAQPVAFSVNTKHTGTVADDVLTAAAERVFRLTPNGIITSLDLRKANFSDFASYGHFGLETSPIATWENTAPFVEQLRQQVG